MLTKARKQAVTRCWAAGDEDWRRRWVELGDRVDAGCFWLLDPSIRLEEHL